MDIPLPNITRQYHARINQALILLDDEMTEAEGITLLEGISREPFVPIWYILAVNLALCWAKAPSEAQAHCIVARQAHDEIAQRWPNLAELSNSHREEWAKYTSELTALEDAIPRCIAEDNQLPSSEESADDSDVVDSHTIDKEPVADSFDLMDLDRLESQTSEMTLANPFIDRDNTFHQSIPPFRLHRRASHTSLLGTARSFSNLRNEVVHEPTLHEDDSATASVQNDVVNNSDKKTATSKSSGKGSHTDRSRMSSLSHHFLSTKSSSSPKTRPTEDDHYLTGSPAQKRRHD